MFSLYWFEILYGRVLGFVWALAVFLLFRYVDLDKAFLALFESFGDCLHISPRLVRPVVTLVYVFYMISSILCTLFEDF